MSENRDEWMDIDTAPKGHQVLVAYRNRLGKWRRVIATYYQAGTLMADDDCENCDYNGYAHEGWYEESESHEYILPTDCPPELWQPLPFAPND